MTEHHIDKTALDALVEALLLLDGEAECRAFLSDLCTPRELDDLSQRLQVAAFLKEGRNYQDISKITGASTATISRVKQALVRGSGGYETILERQRRQ